ncbi:alpha/beta fold hydrolase [Paenibacillus sp. MSJ-34]|uniref:alpha/beta fold hydrolase n=1 Tax=Paenibacillus sp. MSJ-34 TaxID=2841529 RepID=UPI001C119B65|nr:alpha/beta hydrolase [Paenibacillus sp. MSJ-34]MBU5443283.1 alpha/beta hydrolase [Paenibacillus sp. MSJ-34]
MNRRFAPPSRHILWIHGWGSSSKIWADLAKEMPEYRHHYIHFGKCRTVDDLRGTIRSAMLELPRQQPGDWHIVAWSMGGMLVLEQLLERAAEQRETTLHIRSVALVSTTLRFSHPDRAKGWPARVLERMRSGLRTDREGTLRQFASFMLSAEEREAGHRIDDDAEFSDEGLDAGLRYLLETDLTARWGAWESKLRPIRLIRMHGTDDAVCLPGALPAACGETPILLFPGAGHAPFLTQRDKFIGKIRGGFAHEHHR